jgi:hypothetical protein
MHERLNLKGRSYALLSTSAPARAVVIFVHGFFGCPEKTWIEFQTLVDSVTTTMPWWADYDAFFYAYNSRTQLGPTRPCFWNSSVAYIRPRIGER